MKTSRDNVAYFEYNGRKSTDFGIRIVNDQEIISPEKNIEFTDIRGADDDFAIDLDSYKSYVKPFNCVIQVVNGYRNTAEQAQAIIEWLNSAPGYTPLFFNGYPNAYWLAMYYEELSIADTFSWRGKAVIQFKVKAKRRLYSGETPITLDNGNSIVNPSFLAAKPLLHLVGTGDIKVSFGHDNGNQTLAFKGLKNEIYVDCETQQAYRNGTNANSELVNIPNMQLKKGKTLITWTGAVTKLEITTRWVTLF